MTDEVYDDISFSDLKFPISYSVAKTLFKKDEKLYSRVKWHKEFEIKRITAGGAVMQIGSETVRVQSGDVALCNPCEPHCITQVDETVQYDVAVFDVRLFESRFEKTDDALNVAPLLSGKRKFRHLVRGDGRISVAAGLLFSELEQSGEHKRTCVSSVLAYLFSLLFDYASDDTTDKTTEEFSMKMRRIQPSVEYINSHYNKDLRLGTVAEKSALSPTYFSRYFKEVMGISVSEYIKTVRVYNAEQLLRFSSEKISVIAAQCGFDDVCYFNRWFKNADGVAPGEFRKRK